MIALSLVLIMGSLSGCSSAFRMPWEGDPLDLSKVRTREPLVIPPNLNTLPPIASEPRVNMETAGDATADSGIASGDSASTILFGTGSSQEAPEMGRHERERLPSWMKQSTPQQ